MQEKDRENIALFRFGLIAPLLNDQVDKGAYLAEICSKKHEVPYWGSKEYTPKTVAEWVRLYKRDGFDMLKPKARSDRGKSRRIPEDISRELLSYRGERRDLPITLFYEAIIKKGFIKHCDFSYATVYRLLKKHDLVGKGMRKEPERKRFAHEKINALWQVDASSGIYLDIEGKKKATFLIAFIDDCSRIVPSGRFSFTENTDDLMQVFEEAILRRGLPKLIYADNGKIFRSDQFHLACASLGITLLHTRCFDAPAKGKIEKYFGTLKMRFFPLLREKKITSLDELNRFYWQWMEQDYHRRVHSALDMSPLDKYLSQISRVKMVEDPESLKFLFLKRDYRKVRHDGTISLKNRLFEVPPVYIGQKIEVRHDDALKQVYIFSEGRVSAEATAVNFADNARAKRQSPVLSFAQFHKRGDDDV